LRLSRTAAARAPLHGRSPMPTPLRFTTASTPSKARRRSAGRRVPAPLVRRRRGPADQPQTSCSAARRWATRAVTDQPEDPATTTRTAMILPNGRRRATRAGPTHTTGRSGPPGARRGPKPQLALEPRPPPARLDRRDEPAGVRAVDQAVVVGQREEALGPDRDDVARPAR
jgi:hypothetical protein